jgi:hypothetical protein
MYSLIYVSSATVPFAPGQLRDLMSVCVENNRKAGITGMLLYKDGNFMQVLEGMEERVRNTHAQISRDGRHRGLITLLESSVAERQFPEWSMAFRDLTAAGSAADGFNDFLNAPRSGTTELSAIADRARVLLHAFKRNM